MTGRTALTDAKTPHVPDPSATTPGRVHLAVREGFLIEPRTASGAGALRWEGATFVRDPVHRGHRCFVDVVAVRGGVAYEFTARFASSSEAERTAARLAMRLGPSMGRVRHAAGAAAVISTLIDEERAPVSQDAGFDEAARFLSDFANGSAFDLGRIVRAGDTGVSTAATCVDGSTWIEVLTMRAAGTICAKGVLTTLGEIRFDLTYAAGDAPEGRHFVLEHGPDGERRHVVSASSLPKGGVRVFGRGGADPLVGFHAHLTTLSEAVGVDFLSRSAFPARASRPPAVDLARIGS